MLSVVALAADPPQPACRTYDPDPQHLWNRLHATLFVRVGPDGESYGCDRIDPLFWGNTRHLLAEDSHHQALRVLDEFLQKRGERSNRDPLKRAFLQHDLWSLFDWSAKRPDSEHYARERKELQTRLATLMRRVALTSAEIASLPDNYARAQASNASVSLPRGLVFADADWVNVSLGPNVGAVAPSHLADFGGRWVFHVWLRLPEGRPATIAYLKKLRSFERPWSYSESSGSPELMLNPALPQFPAGTQWALTRRMLVIDSEGRIQPTSIVESIQVRRYVVVPSATDVESTQQVVKFAASRSQNADLHETLQGERDFFQFMSHDVDPFEYHDEKRSSRKASHFRNWLQQDILQSCRGCHGGSPGIHSVQSYARFGQLQALRVPSLTESDEDRESPATVAWKQSRYDFGLLQGLWRRGD